MALRRPGRKSTSVRRVASVPCFGAFIIGAVVSAGAGIYIPGDVDYLAALETLIRLVDVGHFILEEIMMRTFADMLRKACAPVTVTFFKAADPFIFEGVA